MTTALEVLRARVRLGWIGASVAVAVAMRLRFPGQL